MAMFITVHFGVNTVMDNSYILKRIMDHNLGEGWEYDAILH